MLIGSPGWDALLEAGRCGPAELLAERQAALSPDDPINIQYTSGTTGFPKGATLSHHNILNNGYLVGQLSGYTPADRVCIPVPFYHCFGMVLGNLACTSNGATMVIPAPAFDPTATLAAVATERCTSLYGVPTMFIAELNHPDFESYDLTSLRTGIMGGSPCPVEVMKQVISRMGMKEVTICYGMTETSPVSTQTRTDDSLDRRVSTVGLVHPHLEVKIVDPETGLTVPRGEPGELCTRGYSVMLGYWNEPDKTAEAIDAGTLDAHRRLGASWTPTATSTSPAGSRTWSSGAGRTSTRGRSRNSFTPTQTSSTRRLSGCPTSSTARSCVPGSRSAQGAQPLTAEKLREFAAGRLARYKVPRYVIVVDEFPLTVTGKVRKLEMREKSVGLLALEDAAAIRHA